MKIVHVIWALGVGGSESMLIDIVNEQSRTQEIHLIIINNIIDEHLRANVSDRVKCHFINRPPGSRNPFYILLFNFLLLTINPHIVHCHNEELIKISYFHKIFNYRIYLTAHTTNIIPDNFNKFDKIFSISDAVKFDILKNSGIKAITIFNGIAIGKIHIKKELSFKIFKVVQIGRLDKRTKGQDILLEALSVLIKNYKFENISVDFIGVGESKIFLLEMAEKLNISNYCNFVGSKERDYIYKHLKDYNLLVQPSLYEGFGLTVVEGMAAKLPVLVSDIEGPMEIINNGEFGYHFKSEDSKDCADKLLEIIQGYQTAELQDKVNKGYKYIEQRFSIQNTAKEYINNYG